MVARLALALLFVWCWLAPAFATPARIIILRHGEKAGAWKLCGVGQARADALAATYLGRDAAQSLFAAGEEPGAFLAITLHTLELAAPAAATWDLPVTMFSVLPQKATEAFDKAANLRTEGHCGAARQSRLAGKDRGDGVGAQAHRQCQARGKIFRRGGHASPAPATRQAQRRAGDLALRQLRLFLDRRLRRRF